MGTYIAVSKFAEGYPTPEEAQHWIDNCIKDPSEWRVCIQSEIGSMKGAITPEQLIGFLAAVDMIRDTEDRYGIGNMCSQWTAAEIANDLLERVGIANHPKLPVKEPALKESEAYIVGKHV